ncbi:MAG: hypothetical protein GY886_11135 [Gammaproteobacteria bacterium]|nr:hypothetical protein [Gammaproteobacteria bacterium]
MPTIFFMRSLVKVVPAAILMVVLCGPATAGQKDGFKVNDPHYGEVLFNFYQQEYFTALTDLLVSRDFNRLIHHQAEAALLEGGLLLSWGQHEEADQIFERLLSNTDDQAVRDRTWFYLGKVRYQRGYVDAAEQAFLNIRQPLPLELDAERLNLLARVYIDQERYSAAAAVLSGWEGPEIWLNYARYNLGVALVRMGQLEAGAELLSQVGTIWAYDEEQLALRDRANLALGFAYLQAGLEGNAKPILQRVRLNGPFSNKALLGAGWADSANNDYHKALAPWQELNRRELLDSAVQESLLAVPYAFSQLDAEPQAAEYYARALNIFDAEIVRLDVAMDDMGNGQLITDLLDQDQSSAGGWYWQLASLPNDDRARYLYFAIADHNFHEGLKSYRDLMSLGEHLDVWQTKLSTYHDMLNTRKNAYSKRLPILNERIAEFDVVEMQASYEDLQQRTTAARNEHDVLALATASEQEQWRRISLLEDNITWSQQESAALREKQSILKGLLLWNMEREFNIRAWHQDKQIEKLGEEINKTVRNFTSIDTTVGGIPETVFEFDSRIAFLQLNLDQMKRKLQLAKERHATYLYGLVVGEMQAQRKRLVSYRAQARFALASIYDRLSMKGQ